MLLLVARDVEELLLLFVAAEAVFEASKSGDGELVGVGGKGEWLEEEGRGEERTELAAGGGGDWIVGMLAEGVVAEVVVVFEELDDVVQIEDEEPDCRGVCVCVCERVSTRVIYTRVY